LNFSVIGLQWGDEGKGKIVDYISGNCAAVVRFNGGSNAGHTVVKDGKKYVFHLLPSGAARGKEMILASGVAVDPIILSEEIGKVSGKILIDSRCSVVTPYDKKLDEIIEEKRGSLALGTTRRGIGPSYAMRALRLEPRVCDILANDFNFEALATFYDMMHINGNLQEWIEYSRNVLKGIEGDSGARVVELNEKGEEVVFEGSQGSLLDIMHGSYPYVTSSHTLSTYIPLSLGLSKDIIGDTIGVMKCYATRVGSGPFPSEEKGVLAEEIRRIGNEYGATTGRARRIGWLDFVSLKYAVRMNGVKEVAITKVDVLSKIRQLKICRSYSVDGEEISDFFKAIPRLDDAKAELEGMDSLHGYDFSIGMRGALKKLIELIEEELKVSVRLVSYGEERSETFELSR
jgi:adenylosuccinate synthase